MTLEGAVTEVVEVLWVQGHVAIAILLDNRLFLLGLLDSFIFFVVAWFTELTASIVATI